MLSFQMMDLKKKKKKEKKTICMLLHPNKISCQSQQSNEGEWVLWVYGMVCIETPQKAKEEGEELTTSIIKIIKILYGSPPLPN